MVLKFASNASALAAVALASVLSTAACSSPSPQSESSATSANELSNGASAGKPGAVDTSALAAALASCGCSPLETLSTGARERVFALCPDTAALAPVIEQYKLTRATDLDLIVPTSRCVSDACASAAPDGDVYVFRDFTFGIPICAGLACGIE